MNSLLKIKRLSVWRVGLWAALAAACLAGLGLYFRDRTLLIAAPFGGVTIGAFGLLLNWSQTSPWVRRRLGWLLALGAVGNVVLFIWDILRKK